VGGLKRWVKLAETPWLPGHQRLWREHDTNLALAWRLDTGPDPEAGSGPESAMIAGVGSVVDSSEHRVIVLPLADTAIELTA
jgi:hypothetical protein